MRGPLLLAALSGCSFGFGGGGSCGLDTNNGALGKANFAFVCSCAPPPSDDAWCDTNPGGGLPDVAVGAPFAISADGAVAPDNSAAQPAAPKLAQSVPQGWALVQPGWLGFVIYESGKVYDYIHVRGRSVASVRLAMASPTPDAAPSSLLLGAPAAVAATAFAEDGTMLAGSLPCSFASSNPDVVAVAGRGRVGGLSAQTIGDATITATCLGKQAQLPVHFDPPPDAGMADAQMGDDGADEGPGEGASDGEGDGGGEAGDDSAADGGAGDATDSGAPADAEGG